MDLIDFKPKLTKEQEQFIKKRQEEKDEKRRKSSVQFNETVTTTTIPIHEPTDPFAAGPLSSSQPLAAPAPIVEEEIVQPLEGVEEDDEDPFAAETSIFTDAGNDTVPELQSKHIDVVEGVGSELPMDDGEDGVFSTGISQSRSILQQLTQSYKLPAGINVRSYCSKMENIRTHKWSKAEMRKLIDLIKNFGADVAAISRVLPKKNARAVTLMLTRMRKDSPKYFQELLMYSTVSAPKEEYVEIVKDAYAKEREEEERKAEDVNLDEVEALVKAKKREKEMKALEADSG
ncbi:hypothetical protein ADUPG1_012205, partial [Aduncisulcus paluster]